ncbi:MAG: RHS repeat-associated core domain-containing protein [Sediminibacterium sp.]
MRGPLLEETHYYPFGLTMAGISSKAAGKLENRMKFNDGTELTTDLGLDWYETTYRGYDAQLGRFHQIDPITEMTDNWSPYAFVQNNPILYNDPLGLDTLKRNKDGALPTARPDGSDLQDTDVVLGEDGQVSNYYNGQGWQTPNQLDEVTVTSSPKKKGGFWNGVLDVVQTGIDVVGLIPVVGEIADGANSLIYLARGDKTNAALSAASMIPIAGWAATGTKFVVKTVNVTAKARKATDALKLAERILGKGYQEIAPGVFRSADGLKQFRMTASDLAGKQFDGIPHVHIEVFDSKNLNVPLTNYHIPLKD